MPMDVTAPLYPELPDDVRALVAEHADLAGFALRLPRREIVHWSDWLRPTQRLWWCAMVRPGSDPGQVTKVARQRFEQAEYNGGRCLWLRPVDPEHDPAP
jgi:hypothetical protein